MKKTYNIKSLVLICLLITVNHLSAQESKINIWVGGGLPAISYSDFNGDKSGNLGIIGGIGYKHFFTENFALNIGAEYGYYKSNAQFDKLTFSRQEIDSENDAFNFITDINGYEEKHSLNRLNIPITAEYNFPLNSKLSIYAMGGIKISLPLSAKFETKMDKLKTHGFYEQWNLPMDEMPEYGFVDLTNINYDDKIETKTGFGLTFEAGLNLGMVYLGGFFDYGLNEVIKSDKQKYVYNYNSANSALETVNMFETNSIKSARLMMGGVKLSLSLSIFNKKTNKEISE